MILSCGDGIGWGEKMVILLPGNGIEEGDEVCARTS